MINHANFDEIIAAKSLDHDNSTDREIPRVIMSVQDLETMSSGFNRIPYYILNYLRRLQYQSSHKLANEGPRYSNFMVAGIHDYKRTNYFIEYEKVIMDFYETKKIDRFIAKDLLYGLDYNTIESMAELQESFRQKFNNIPEINLSTFTKDFSLFEHNRTGYATMFYNSSRIPPNTYLIDQLDMVGNDYLERFSTYIDKIMVIAVDVKTDPEKTVGTFLWIG